jgi:S-adenosylmethionine:tRNA ribosyltransferase-isomerase
MLDIKSFSYSLPKTSIASTPATPRDHSKLLVLNRQTGGYQDLHFYDLADLLSENDVLVLNQTKVFPARLYGTKSTGGKCEILLLKQLATNSYECIGTNLKSNLKITFSSNLFGQIISHNTVQFNLSGLELLQEFNLIGHTPLPPYIVDNTDSETELRTKYQTVYAKTGSSAAAPTAGLHFTTELLEKLNQKNIQIEFVTLNVGLGTFQNLRPENLSTKTLHTESFDLEPAVATRLNLAKQDGKRIIAVGTTTTRVLETCTENKVLVPQKIIPISLFFQNTALNLQIRLSPIFICLNPAY